MSSDGAPRRPAHAPAGPTRRLPLSAPQRAWAMSEWALLPLRLFLGVTFIYAALNKLANPAFTDAKSTISIQAQIAYAAHTSPIGGLLTHLQGDAALIGWVIAFAELFVGLGTLLGLWTRAAAIGGLVISLSLFLTVSYHSHPYFTGSDIVFFFAWIPLIIAGGGSRLSVDARLRRLAARQVGAPNPALVAIPFATVQTLCGNYDQGRCRALRGPCDHQRCPVIAGEATSLYDRRHLNVLDRRSLIVSASAVAGSLAGALAVGGVVAEAGRLMAKGSGTGRTLSASAATATTTTAAPGGAAPTSTTPATTTTHPAGTLLGNASQVPTNEAASFTIPSNNEPGIVVHPKTGPFVAYNAVCPHLGCTVGYSPSAQLIICPCHGSEFEVANGDVVTGPAPRGLTKLDLVEEGNGNLYLQ